MSLVASELASHTASSLKPAGGYNLKIARFKLLSGANSYAITGIVYARDKVQWASGVKWSATTGYYRTSIDLTATTTIPVAGGKVLQSTAAHGCTSGLFEVCWVDNS